MEKPNNIVLDASVVVKWFVDEEYTNKALKILDDYAKGTIMAWLIWMRSPLPIAESYRKALITS